MTWLMRLAVASCMMQFGFGWNSSAHAETLHAPDELEFVATKAELERLAAGNSDEAETAGKALKDLLSPQTDGRQTRGRLSDRNGRRIVNGVPASGYPAVGALLTGSDGKSARFKCTGTLVGCDKFLTAAHCVVDDDRPGVYHVFLQEFGFFKVTEVRWPKQEYKKPYASHDLAMLTLAPIVTGATPMAINLNPKAKMLKNAVATIVGFGRTGGDRYDYGIRRIGSTRIGTCTSKYAQDAICWRYDALIRPNRSRSNTCNGDSGGGVLMVDDDGRGRTQKIFGVVSGGTDAAHCQQDDEGYNVEVAAFANWINEAGEGRVSSQKCGAPELESVSRSAVLHLDRSTDSVSLPIEVPPGTHQFRVAMNGEDNGKGESDFNLLVYDGPQIVPSDAACTETGSGQFAYCEVSSPVPRRWTIVVERNRGQGSVQLTTTIVRRRTP